jgi:hypothetical protein
MKKITIWALLLMLTACRTKLRDEQVDTEIGQLKRDTTYATIIPWDSSFNYPFSSGNHRPSILTQQEINQVEGLLVSRVADYNNSLSDEEDEYKIDLKNKGYKKQLIAVINSKGEKEIWVNCFCSDWGAPWKTEILIVDDGGPCYFNFKINLTTKKIYEFVVNGFA